MTRSTLRYGSRGDDVIAWQRTLDVTRDGVFGVRTQTATEAWQRARGLHPDGIVGPKTWAAAEREADPMGESAPVPPSPSPISLSAWRARIIGHLRPLAGLRDPSPDYRDAIIASDRDRSDPVRRGQLGAMSSCALLVRATWAACGVRHPILEAPYRTGRAMSDVVQIGREAGALLPLTARPRPGDAVVVTGGEHALTVTAWEGDTLHSIDGGQGPGGRAILSRDRPWRPGWVGDRRIIAIVDADLLAHAHDLA